MATTVKEVLDLEEGLLAGLQHVKNCSPLLKLIVGAESLSDDEEATDEAVCTAAIHSLRRFFLKQCKQRKREMVRHLKSGGAGGAARPSKKQRRLAAAERAALSAVGVSSTSTESTASASAGAQPAAADRLRSWVQGRYKEFVSRLTDMLYDGSPTQQVLALRTLMKLIAVDAPFVSTVASRTTFGHVTLQDVTRAIVAASEPLPADVLGVLREEYLNTFNDTRCYVLSALSSTLGAFSGSDDDADKQASSNALEVLLQAQLRVAPGASDAKSMTLMAKSLPVGDQPSARSKDSKSSGAGRSKRPRGVDTDDSGATAKVESPQHHQKVFGQAWMAVLQRPLFLVDYRKSLLVLPTRVVPCMSNPLVLSDFLTDSYNLGGVSSVLALQSLFDLIMKHNLDYPDFFAKLYLLLKPSVMHTKYRARFLRLLGTFLASPLMPAYIVASFAKRLSWLALHGTPASGLYVCALVHNLLQRHPSCLAMIQRKRKSSTIAKLGNKAFAPPPTLSVDSKIMKSSLYELKGLRSHYCPSLASMASVFEKALDKAPYNLEEFASNTYNDLFEMEVRRGEKKARKLGSAHAVATNYRNPPPSVLYGDDTFRGCFDVPQPAPVVLPPLQPPVSGDGSGEEDSESSDEEEDTAGKASPAADSDGGSDSSSTSSSDSSDSDSDSSEEEG